MKERKLLYDENIPVMYINIKPEDNESALENLHIFYNKQNNRKNKKQFDYVRFCNKTMYLGKLNKLWKNHKIVNYYEWLEENYDIIIATQMGLY